MKPDWMDHTPQAAQEAQAPVVETVEQAMNELPF